MNNLEITIDQLFQGCITSSIAHAVWSRKYPFAKYWHYWDGSNCHFNDLEGDLATITFLKNKAVGMIFRKNHFQKHSIITYQKRLNNTLNEIPPNLKEMAEEETIQYFMQKIQGQKVPLVSNIFWSSGKFLFSLSSKPEWEDFWLKFLKTQLMDFNSTLSACKTEYSLDTNEMHLIAFLAKKKIQNPNEILNIHLNKEAKKSLYQGNSNTTINLLRKMNISVDV